MTSSQATSFPFGILSPAQIQAPDPDSLAATPCHDVGKYLSGGPVTIRGVCVAKFGNLYYIDGSTNLRDGVALFAPPAQLAVGNRYEIVGTNTEFNAETEMS